MSLLPGTRLGAYEVLTLIGAGGMGEVYRARDPRLGRDVAIKVLPAAFSTDTERLRRFEQEARAAAAINHPNILAVYDIGSDCPSTSSGQSSSAQATPYIVSELLEGATLRERLAQPHHRRRRRSRATAARPRTLRVLMAEGCQRGRLWTAPCKSPEDWPQRTKRASSTAT